jgi:hypothetical protein
MGAMFSLIEFIEVNKPLVEVSPPEPSHCADPDKATIPSPHLPENGVL